MRRMLLLVTLFLTGCRTQQVHNHLEGEHRQFLTTVHVTAKIDITRDVKNEK